MRPKKIYTYRNFEYRKSDVKIPSVKHDKNDYYKLIPCLKNLYEYKYLGNDGKEHWRKIDATTVTDVKVFFDSLLRGEAEVLIPIYHPHY